MTDGNYPRRRGNGSGNERITPTPDEPIAGGLVQPDPEPAAPQRRGLLWVLGGAIAVFAIGLGSVGFAILNKQHTPTAQAEVPIEVTPSPDPFPHDNPAVTWGEKPCAVVNVLSSFENAEMVENLAEGYNAVPRDVNGRCVTIVPTKDRSGVAATRAAASFSDVGPDERPVIWLPDSSSWFDIARDNGATIVPPDGTSLGSTAIVLAMPAPLAYAIGWNTTAPSWQEVFEASDDPDVWVDLGHEEWGTFKLGKTSPLVATSGEAALLASFGAAGDGLGTTSINDLRDPTVIETVKNNELATSHYMATPEHFLWHAREAEAAGGASADFLSAVIVDEKSVWDYNRGIVSRDGVTRSLGNPPRDPLVPIYPTDGVFMADNPAAVLAGDWINVLEAAAAEDFIRFAGTIEGQKIVADSGYRDLHGKLAPSVDNIGKLPSHIPLGIAMPSKEVVSQLQTVFPEVRKRASVLFLIDVSGSMSTTIQSGETKLDAAKSAITAALGHFTPGDAVGLAAFSSGWDATVTPGLVTPVEDIASNRDALIAGVDGLTPQSFTPLYAAVDQFTALQAANHDPDRINAIVLLSDGANETAAPTIDAGGMLANIGALHHHGSPVLVFTLAYGADADVSTLQQISSATGAHFYDATDPSKVTAILGDLVTSF